MSSLSNDCDLLAKLLWLNNAVNKIWHNSSLKSYDAKKCTFSIEWNFVVKQAAIFLFVLKDEVTEDSVEVSLFDCLFRFIYLKMSFFL